MPAMNKFFRDIYSARTEMDKLLILSSAFSVLLVLTRTIITGQLFFIFLPWNLFLAAVPYFISTKLINKPGWSGSKWKFSLVLLVWILFIPNSFYILTDLFHLKLTEGTFRWFDLTLIFSFAWNGILLGVLSVRQMEKVVSFYYKVRNQFVFLLPVMWLIALGIYIGRFLRFNSWDVITNPLQLIKDIGYMFIHPFGHFYIWAMIGCFAVFMTIIYISIKRISRSLV
ncbi:MAG TPA: DUF1361 domain-containing protein [Chitinophagaceae bacterium]